MSDAGDKIKAALERHNASLESSRTVAAELAAKRDAAVRAAVPTLLSPASPPESNNV